MKIFITVIAREIGVEEFLSVLLTSDLFVLLDVLSNAFGKPHCVFMVLVPLKIIISPLEHLKQNNFNVNKNKKFSSKKSFKSLIFLKVGQLLNMHNLILDRIYPGLLTKNLLIYAHKSNVWKLFKIFNVHKPLCI